MMGIGRNRITRNGATSVEIDKHLGLGRTTFADLGAFPDESGRIKVDCGPNRAKFDPTSTTYGQHIGRISPESGNTGPVSTACGPSSVKSVPMPNEFGPTLAASQYEIGATGPAQR